EVRPGRVPCAGWRAEPLAPTLDDAPNAELVDMRRRLVVSSALTLPLLPFAMAEMVPGRSRSDVVASRALAWLQLAFAAPVVLWGGAPFFARGLASLRTRRLNIFTLIAL